MCLCVVALCSVLFISRETSHETQCVCVWLHCAVFFSFLVKPLMKLNVPFFARRSVNFFMSVVDQSVSERKTTVDDEEVV